MIKLYDYELSGDCYKVRLLLHILRRPYERIELDCHPGREHRSPWFLAINPLGEVPVVDDGIILRDAQAILVYLASRYDGSGHWYPREPAATVGQTAMWLGFASHLAATAGAARQHDTLFYSLDIDKYRGEAHTSLRVLDEHLWFAEQQGRQWLCDPTHPTIADLACFPPVTLSEEGGISHLPYPAIRRWLDRVKRIPGFTTMAGVFG